MAEYHLTIPPEAGAVLEELILAAIESSPVAKAGFFAALGVLGRSPVTTKVRRLNQQDSGQWVLVVEEPDGA